MKKLSFVFAVLTAGWLLNAGDNYLYFQCYGNVDHVTFDYNGKHNAPSGSGWGRVTTSTNQIDAVCRHIIMPGPAKWFKEGLNENNMISTNCPLNNKGPDELYFAFEGTLNIFFNDGTPQLAVDNVSIGQGLSNGYNWWIGAPSFSSYKISISSYFILAVKTGGVRIMQASGSDPNQCYTFYVGPFPIWATGTGGQPDGECTSTFTSLKVGATPYAGEKDINLQEDGNLVIYTVNPIWASNTGGRPEGDTYRLEVQNDGNLTIIDTTTGQNIWYSGSGGHPGSDTYRLDMQDDGNLTILDVTTGQHIWYSGSGGHPIGNYSYKMQSDGNLVVYRNLLWESGTGGHPNATVFLQDDGNLVIYDRDPDSGWKWTNLLWSSGSGGNPADNTLYSTFQSDGNLVIYSNK